MCLIGDLAVGKTSLIKRYVFDEFDDRYLSTLGTKITKREMFLEYPKMNLEVDVTVLIYDMIGEKGFRRLLQDVYFHGAGGLMAVCAVTEGETLDSMEEWVENAYGVAGEIPLHVIGNKIDLKDQTVLSEEEVKRVSTSYHSPCDFTSAKTGENVEKAFESIARRIANRAIEIRLEGM